MGSVNLGAQNILWRYKTPLNGSVLAQVVSDIVPEGVYRGLEVSKLSDTVLAVTKGILYIRDSASVDRVVKINFAEDFQVTVVPASQYLVCRYSWLDSVENFADIRLTAAPLATDVILAAVTESGGVISSVDNGYKNQVTSQFFEPLQHYGQVRATFPPTLNLVVGALDLIKSNGEIETLPEDSITLPPPAPGGSEIIVFYEQNTDVSSFSLGYSIVGASPLPVGAVPLALVTLADGATQINPGDIRDCRWLWRSDSAKRVHSLYVDGPLYKATSEVIPNLNSQFLEGIRADQFIGFRNHIMNARFEVSERGTSRAVSTGESVYLVDRFMLSLSGVGASSTMSRQPFTLGQVEVPDNPSFFLRSMCTNGGDAINGSHLLKTHIEDVTKLAGKQLTLSFYAKADTSKDISIEIEQGFGTGGAPSGVVSTFVEKIAITATWNKYEVSFTLPTILGKTLGSDGVPTSYTALVFHMSAGSALDLRTGSLGVQVGTFDFALPQLEEGNEATKFETRPIGLERSLCRRYYEKSFAPEVPPAGNTGQDYFSSPLVRVGTVDQGVFVSYKEPKRVVGSLTLYNPASLVGNVRAYDSANTSYNLTVDPSVFSKSRTGFNVDVGATAPAKVLAQFNWEVDADF